MIAVFLSSYKLIRTTVPQTTPSAAAVFTSYVHVYWGWELLGSPHWSPRRREFVLSNFACENKYSRSHLTRLLGEPHAHRKLAISCKFGIVKAPYRRNVHHPHKRVPVHGGMSLVCGVVKHVPEAVD